MTIRIIRLHEVLRMTGLSRSSIYRMEKSGRFPPRRQLGQHAVGWLLHEVTQWIEEIGRGPRHEQ